VRDRFECFFKDLNAVFDVFGIDFLIEGIRIPQIHISFPINFVKLFGNIKHRVFEGSPNLERYFRLYFKLTKIKPSVIIVAI